MPLPPLAADVTCGVDPRCHHLFRITRRNELGSRLRQLCYGGRNIEALKHLDVCFNASMFATSWMGPSEEALRGAWGEGSWLRPLFDTLLDGSCIRADGSRKLIVDIGANIGLYSLFFLALGCEVHAFEPLPINAEHLELSARLNGFINRLTIHRIAVGQAPRNATLRTALRATGYTHIAMDDSDMNGTEPLVRAKSSSNKTSYLDGYLNKYVKGPKTPHAPNLQWSVMSVPVERIDTALSSSPHLQQQHPHQRQHASSSSSLPTIDWMKVDTEGGELEAFCAASRLLRAGKVRSIGYELNSDTTTHNQARRIGWLLHRHRLLPAVVPGLPKWSLNGFLLGRTRTSTKAYMVVHTLARSEEEWREETYNSTRWLPPEMAHSTTAALCSEELIGGH